MYDASADTSVEPYKTRSLASVGAAARNRCASVHVRGSPEQSRRRRRLARRRRAMVMAVGDARRAARSVGVSVRRVAPCVGWSAAAQKARGSVSSPPPGGRRRLVVCGYVCGCGCGQLHAWGGALVLT